MAAVAIPSGPQGLPDDVFASIFPPKTHIVPTPEATPNIGTLASPGAPFGGFNLPSDPIDEAVKFNQAWGTVTRAFSLTNRDVPIRIQRNVEDALEVLLRVPGSRKDLASWYLDETTAHLHNRAPDLYQRWSKPVSVQEANEVLDRTVSVLREVQILYFSCNPSPNPNISSFLDTVQSDFRVRILHSLPLQRIRKTLACHFFIQMETQLNLGNQEMCLKRGRCRCKIDLPLDRLSGIREAGFGDGLGERALAHAIHKLLQRAAVERRCFEVDWNDRQPVMSRVRTWVHEMLVPAAQDALVALTGNRQTHLQIDQFESAAVSSFGRLRIEDMFEYVSTWPISEGAVLDIREYLNVSGTAEKAHLCSSFSAQMQQRLMHAGASTSEILSMYINIINVFKVLDARGVLLEKVAIPIRSYLRVRDDTVTIIAASLLTDVPLSGEIQGHDLDKICIDITTAIADSAIDAQDNKLHNWNDMEWVPDPIDAGPNYKSSKADDVVAYILGLFDPDDFIKALSVAFGDHLLRVSETELGKETRLVELMKSRLDATKLQQIEVMLKDIRDSAHINRRINPEQHRSQYGPKPTPKEIQAALPEDGITMISLFELFKQRMEHKEFLAALQLVARRRNDLWFPKRTRLPLEPQTPSHQEMQFEIKVLSSYFWPPLRDVNFRIPPPVGDLMEKYESAFAGISGQRKLEWKHGLGTTDLILELEDRTIEEYGVDIWKAGIIDAFASDRVERDDEQAINYDGSVGLSLPDLMEALDMDEDYALSGLSFWLSKRVLYEISEGRYAVLERLDMDIEYAQDATQLDVEAISAVKSEDAMLRENAPMYQNFIDGMLRNQGAKEVEGMMGITNMLKMVMPTFTGGDNEVKWLLEDMESKGSVKKMGNAWAVA